MEYHGLKIDATGIAALIMAATAFYTAVWGAKKKERRRARKSETDTDESVDPHA